MALSITYWGGSGNPNIAGSPIASEDLAISASSAQSGATPDNAVYVSIVAGEATRFLYGANPTALLTSAAIKLNERLWLDAKSGYKIAGIAG